MQHIELAPLLMIASTAGNAEIAQVIGTAMIPWHDMLKRGAALGGPALVQGNFSAAMDAFALPAVIGPAPGDIGSGAHEQ